MLRISMLSYMLFFLQFRTCGEPNKVIAVKKSIENSTLDDNFVAVVRISY